VLLHGIGRTALMGIPSSIELESCVKYGILDVSDVFRWPRMSFAVIVPASDEGDGPLTLISPPGCEANPVEPFTHRLGFVQMASAAYCQSAE
jgi:hypothetical protein